MASKTQTVQPHHPLVVIKCSKVGNVHFHDHSAASKFLDDLRISLVSADTNVSVSIASEHGKGWRSRIAKKKAKCDEEARTNDVQGDEQCVKMIGAQDVASDGISSMEEREGKSRLNAVETAIRAQFQVSRDGGRNCRFAFSALSRDQVALRNVALHNFDLDAPFETLSPGDCRRIQHGHRKSVHIMPPKSTTDAGSFGSQFCDEVTSPLDVSSVDALVSGDPDPYDGTEGEDDECTEVINLSLAASACSTLISTGCVALRIVFNDSGEADDIESVDIASCKYTRSFVVHHNEETVAALLKIILVEVQGQPSDDHTLVDGILDGLTRHYNLEDTTMRFHGWLGRCSATLCLVWHDLRDDQSSSDMA